MLNPQDFENAKAALTILSRATEPGIKLSRLDMVRVENSLQVLANIVQSLAPKAAPAAKPTTIEKAKAAAKAKRAEMAQDAGNPPE